MSKHALGAGVTLALVLAAAPAFAQRAPGHHDSGAQASASAPASTDTRRAMVVRDEWSGGYRAPMQGDRGIGVAGLAEFMAAGQTEADFNRAMDGTMLVCRETGGYVRESIAIMAEAGEIDGDLVTLAEDLARLGDAQNRVSWQRRGFTLLSTGLLCALSSGLYCGAAAASGLGNELSSSQHDRAMRHNNRASQINNRQSRLQLRATLLTMRMNIGWSKMIHGYCLQYHPDQTLGIASAAS